VQNPQFFLRQQQDSAPLALLLFDKDEVFIKNVK
jgi:hypothetical protein